MKPGDSLAKAKSILKLSKPIQVGVNTWYVATRPGANGILKVRNGTIWELGLANKLLTTGAKAQSKFLANLG